MMDFYSFNFKIVGVLDGCLKRNYLLKLAGGMVQLFFFSSKNTFLTANYNNSL